MNFKKLLFFFSIFLLSACNQFDKNNKSLVYISDQKYSNTGFALIYEDYLVENKTVNKKINNDEIIVLHSFLKKNTPVRITNLDNSKYID